MVVGDQDGVVTCFGIKKGEAVVSGVVPFKKLIFERFFPVNFESPFLIDKIGCLWKVSG